MELSLSPVVILLLVNLLLLLVIIGISLTSKKNSIEECLHDGHLKQLESLKQLLNENQKNIDDKYSRSQIHLFETISSDREKQLASIESLKLTLEKRFANSEKSLSDNIQSFKVDMIERFEQLKSNTSQSLQTGHEHLTLKVNQFGEKISESMQQHQTSTITVITENIRKGSLI